MTLILRQNFREGVVLPSDRMARCTCASAKNICFQKRRYACEPPFESRLFELDIETAPNSAGHDVDFTAECIPRGSVAMHVAIQNRLRAGKFVTSLSFYAYIVIETAVVRDLPRGLSRASCMIVSGFRAVLDLDTYPLSNLL